MSVREYIGARYVPVFADPIQWDPTSKYEPLTVVTDEGASYVSRRYVPEGIQLDNTDYWVLWADFNAQLQHYIDEVDAFDSRIDALEDALPIADFSSAATVDDALDALSGDVSTLQGKFPVATADIDDGAVTAAKLATDSVSWHKIVNGAVTSEKLAGSVNTKIDKAGNSTKEYVDAVSVAFGDSNMWGQSYTTTNIYQRICNLLGCTYNNFALSSAGFEPVLDVDTVKQQIQNESTVTASDVRLVFIMAGINDFHYGSHNYATFGDAVDEALGAAVNKYTNALVVVMFDGGSQLPDASMLYYHMTMARRAAWHERCIYVPLSDLCTQGNLWYNQNHYNDAGATIVASRVKCCILGGSIVPANPKRRSKTYDVTDATVSGYYGTEWVCNTVIDPINFTRTDEIFLCFSSAGIHNTDGDKTYITSGDTFFEVPALLPKADYSSTRGVIGLPMQTVSSGNVTSETFLMSAYQQTPGNYTDEPIVRFRSRFGVNFSEFSGMIGALQLTFVTTVNDTEIYVVS